MIRTEPKCDDDDVETAEEMDIDIGQKLKIKEPGMVTLLINEKEYMSNFLKNIFF